MKRFFVTILVLAVLVLSGVVLWQFHEQGVVNASANKEKVGQTAFTDPVHNRVIKSGTIRVGYVNVAVAFDVDPKTGEVSGIFADIIREMAKNMNLKLEFVEEVGWGTMIAGLQTKRYDMMASPVWPNSSRARQTTFSNPAYYSAIGIWVKENENRFSPAGGWASLNDPKVKIGAIDGSTAETITITQFPNAQLITYPELAAEGQLFLDVTSGKIDAFFEEPAKGLLYVKNNPGQIKNIAAKHPVKVFPNVFMMPGGSYRMKEMIDTALAEVQNSGFVDRVLAKHEPAPKAYYRVAQPYRSQ